ISHDDLDLELSSDGSSCVLSWADIVFEDRGVYELAIMATDNGETVYYKVDLTVYAWMVELEEGWNLFSIPMTPCSTDIEDVLADVYENIVYEDTSTYSVYHYDAVDDEWLRARRYTDDDNGGFTASSRKLEDVVPGYSYWLNMEAEDVLYGLDCSFDMPQFPVPSVELAAGSWNMVGRYGVDPLEYSNLGLAFETLEGNWFANSLLGFDNDWYLSDKLVVGDGYWLRTSGEGELTYEPLAYYFGL
ncbi:hypothetical protein ACFL0X_02085, partial [Nanoarchaeota archaeon]